jgi:hypothetical protein
MTIGEKLRVKKFPLEVAYNEGSSTYFEKEGGYWEIVERNTKGEVVLHETSNGFVTEHDYTDGKDMFSVRRL